MQRALAMMASGSAAEVVGATCCELQQAVLCADWHSWKRLASARKHLLANATNMYAWSDHRGIVERKVTVYQILARKSAIGLLRLSLACKSFAVINLVAQHTRTRQ